MLEINLVKEKRWQGSNIKGNSGRNLHKKEWRGIMNVAWFEKVKRNGRKYWNKVREKKTSLKYKMIKSDWKHDLDVVGYSIQKRERKRRKEEWER